MTTIIKYSPRVIGEILNIVHDAVFLLNSEKQIIFVNTQMEKMFKANDGQMVDIGFEQLFMPEDRKIMATNILKLTKEKHEFECETMLRCKDGSSFFGLISCFYFMLENEEFIASTIHDITKMKSIERMLKQSEHEAFLGHMLNDISHHIRNPVIVIAGLAKRLKKGESPEQYSEIISKESRRLEMLLETLNDFINLPRPKLRLASLADLIETVESDIKLIAEDFGVRCEWKISKEVLAHKILIDVPLLVKAICAVFLNACESYNKDTKNRIVTIQMMETFDPLLPYALRITDQGCCIKPEDLPFVSSHFFTKKIHHIGMGLTFTQRILEEQGGELHVESSESSGTSVTFFLKKERRRPIRIDKL